MDDKTSLSKGNTRMRDFQNAYSNDGYTEFDKISACWANNHNGWRKAKRKWRRIGKKRIRRETRKMIQEELVNYEIN